MSQIFFRSSRFEGEATENIQKHRSPSSRGRKLLLLIASAAFVLRVEPYLQNGPGIDPDSPRFLELAKGLVTGCGFARRIGDSCAHPELLRAPGYPLFLAIVGSLGASIVLVAGFAAVICYALGMVIGTRWSERAGLLGSVLIAVELPSVLLSSGVMTDALFQCMLAAALLILISAPWRPSPNLVLAMVSAILFGLATLVRPIGEFLWPVAWVPIFFAPRQSVRTRTLFGIAAAVLSLAPILAWSIRNERVSGSFALSTEGPITAYYYTGGQILANDSYVSLASMISVLEREVGVSDWLETPASLDGLLLGRTIGIMASHPLTTIKVETFSFMRMALSPDESWTRGWLRIVPVPFRGEALSMHAGARVRDILRHPALVLLLVYQVAWLVFVWIGAARACKLMLTPRRQNLPPGACVSLTILLYVSLVLYLISGGVPATAGRIRMAFVPALAMLASIGWNLAALRASEPSRAEQQTTVCDPVHDCQERPKHCNGRK